MEEMWADFDNFNRIGVPMCLKVLLWKCGYDTMLSVKYLRDEKIEEMEEHIQKYKNKIFDGNEYLSDYEKLNEKRDVFSFLPAHKGILRDLPQTIREMQYENTLQCNGSTNILPNKMESSILDNGYEEYSVILKELINSANRNQNKPKNAYQYTDLIKHFCTYTFLLCGRMCYETLQKNLPIPSTKTISRWISDSKKCILEGELRCTELRSHLSERKAGNDIWLCEDGSGIVSKIQYDPKSDQLIGMVLPLDENNGCPKRYEYTARDEEEIKKFMQNTRSTLVYIIMAVPLKEGVPPFILQMFGTDNRFTATDVIKRWNHTIESLKRCGINVHGISSDGDTRLLAAMRHQMEYDPNRMCFMQDGIHTTLKLRNRMLRFYDEMPMGFKQVSVAHLKVLIKEVPKLVHGLVYFDISPDDKQNFKSLTKCMDTRVRKAMEEFVADSEATVFYLQLCSEIASSLMCRDVIPQERIEMIFHAVYFLRIWKKWIHSSGYKSKHFITSNAYMCIEVNAANLLKLVRRFRDEGRHELFLTTLFDSQACERTFRQFRAMGTPNFTKVNFTVYELLHMTRRFEVQNDILYSKLPNVKFPKLEKPRETTTIYALPTDEEITQCLNRAKRFAIDDASKFGMQIAPHEIDECEWSIPKKLVIEEEVDEEEAEYEAEVKDFVEESFVDCKPDDEAEFPELLDEPLQHNCLEIKDPQNPNKKLKMRKSTFVWHLTEGTKKMSSDRTIRVQNTKCDQETTTNDGSLDLPSVSTSKANILQYVTIGDWCVFKIDPSDCSNSICVGSVLAFKYSKGKTANEKRYKGDSVDLKEYQTQATKVKDLEVLSSWYSINEMRCLIPVKSENHFFIKIENYVATIAKPMIDKDTRMLFFPENDFIEMENDILRILN